MDDTIESKAAGDDTPPAPKITEITDEPPEKLLGKAEEDDDAGDAGDNAPDPAEDEDAEFVEDGRADKALDFVVAVLSRMGMDCTVDLMENDPGEPPNTMAVASRPKPAAKPRTVAASTVVRLRRGPAVGVTSAIVNRSGSPGSAVSGRS